VGNQALFGRDPGAKFFIPTENEWYKAAYHKNEGVLGDYWDYPTASNTTPINTLPDPGNHANFYDQFHTGNANYTIGNPYYRTEVGAFQNSPSPYGTFDQGGNVWEWNEKVIGSLRGLRGGSFGCCSDGLAASNPAEIAPSQELNTVGFRVASTVPEPSAAILALVGGWALCCLRKRS
jgi:sulfatase modifying factor 1